MPDTPQVDASSAAMAALAEPWPMIAALLGGTAAMRKVGEKLLPKWPNEGQDAYEARLKSTTLFPAFRRTCSVMAAKPFARSVVIDEKTVPERVRALLSDVDLQGTSLQTFAAALMLKCIQYGLVGVLVDTPPKPPEVTTVAAERAAGVRPYLAAYPCGTILGWKTERKGKTSALTQLRLSETYTEPNGPWAEVEKPQVRVLTPGAWQVWRKTTNGAGQQEWALYDEGQTSIDVIPFVFFYGIREDFGIGLPPLEDLAYMNVEHWQSTSDQTNILHVARVPILFAKGFDDDDDIVIGASQATTTESKDAELKYVEHTGKAIEAGKTAIADLEERMIRSGAELLVQRASVKTATQTRSEDEGNRSTLQKIVEDFEESLADCLNLLGLWLGDRVMAAVVALYKDFGSATFTEDGELLLRAAEKGYVSAQTVFDHLQRMDAIAPDQSWEDETKRLAEDLKRLAAKQALLSQTADKVQDTATLD